MGILAVTADRPLRHRRVNLSGFKPSLARVLRVNCVVVGRVNVLLCGVGARASHARAPERASARACCHWSAGER
eukprot:364003-Chlamydomonas_euryale.AAC.32